VITDFVAVSPHECLEVIRREGEVLTGFVYLLFRAHRGQVPYCLPNCHVGGLEEGWSGGVTINVTPATAFE
jgi:hypothetical protein